MGKSILLVEVKDELKEGLSNDHCNLEHIVNKESFRRVNNRQDLECPHFKHLVVKEE